MPGSGTPSQPPLTHPGRVGGVGGDGGGSYPLPRAEKTWRWKLRFGGWEVTLGLYFLFLVSIAEVECF